MSKSPRKTKTFKPKLKANLEVWTYNTKAFISETDTTSFLFKPDLVLHNPIYNMIFIVEGKTDQAIIAEFAKRIFDSENVKKEINILSAAGKYSISKIANSIEKDLDDYTRLILIADSDNDKEETRSLLLNNLENKNVSVVIPDPQIEVWLQDDNIRSSKDLRNILAHKKGTMDSLIKELVSKIDINILANKDMEFKMLYEILTK